MYLRLACRAVDRQIQQAACVDVCRLYAIDVCVSGCVCLWIDVPMCMVVSMCVQLCGELMDVWIDGCVCADVCVYVWLLVDGYVYVIVYVDVYVYGCDCVYIYNAVMAVCMWMLIQIWIPTHSQNEK